MRYLLRLPRLSLLVLPVVCWSVLAPASRAEGWLGWEGVAKQVPETESPFQRTLRPSGQSAEQAWLLKGGQEVDPERWAGGWLHLSGVKRDPAVQRHHLSSYDLTQAWPKPETWGRVAAILDEAVAATEAGAGESGVLAIRAWSAVLRDDAGAARGLVRALTAWAVSEKTKEAKPAEPETPALNRGFFGWLLGAPASRHSYEAPDQKPAAALKLAKALATTLGTAEDLLVVMRAELELTQRAKARGERVDQMEILDLAAIYDEATVRGLLDAYLRTAPEQVRRIEGKATRRLWLDRAVALSVEEGLGLPWTLIDSTEAAARLWPVLSGIHPLDTPEAKKAEVWHCLHLVLELEDEAAWARLSDLLAEGEQARALPWRDLGHVFTRPEWSIWQGKITELAERLRGQGDVWRLALQTGAAHAQGEAVLAALLRVAAREDLDRETAAELSELRLEAWLAADRVDEAVGWLRERADQAEERRRRAARWLAVAVALGRDDWRDEALAAWATDPKEVSGYWYPDSDYRVWRDALLASGRGAEVEQWLAKAYQGVAAESYGMGGDMLLRELIWVYEAAGRPADAVAVMRSGRWRDAGDLSDLLQWGTDGVALVRALRATGAEELAERLLERLLWEAPGNDAAHALWLEWKGEDGRATWEALAKWHPFEERPLIWMAELALRGGRVEEAGRLAGQAVAIDPSDGEQGAGDRMRAYAVLGAVKAAEGDEEGAAFFERVVQAIRKAEEGDRLFEAGLWARGYRTYREALALFDDAYCVQSRLAIQLARAGRMEEAAVHYQRAFELMPSSFGRVESHCFGCERAFEGELAETMAEQTFLRMRVEQPERAQVPYLLGYLREEQERWAEATEFYRDAVRLDPKYFNAWSRLADALQRRLAPREERLEAVRNLIQLDPLRAGRHVSLEAGDWAGLLELALKLQAEIPTPKGPLEALRPGGEPREATRDAMMSLRWNDTVDALSSMLDSY